MLLNIVMKVNGDWIKSNVEYDSVIENVIFN